MLTKFYLITAFILFATVTLVLAIYLFSLFYLIIFITRYLWITYGRIHMEKFESLRKCIINFNLLKALNKTGVKAMATFSDQNK